MGEESEVVYEVSLAGLRMHIYGVGEVRFSEDGPAGQVIGRRVADPDDDEGFVRVPCDPDDPLDSLQERTRQKHLALP